MLEFSSEWYGGSTISSEKTNIMSLDGYLAANGLDEVFNQPKYAHNLENW